MGLKELKATVRRKRIRDFIRQGLTQVEMANRLGVDYTTISEDVKEIEMQNSNSIMATKAKIEKDVDNLLQALDTINQLEMEAWKVYYGAQQIVRREKKKDAETGVETEEEVVDEYQTPLEPKTKLTALEQIRQCNLDRAKLLKLLNPTQINIEKMTYINKMMPVLITQVIEIAREFIPADKQLEFLSKMEQVDVEGGLDVK